MENYGHSYSVLVKRCVRNQNGNHISNEGKKHTRLSNRPIQFGVVFMRWTGNRIKVCGTITSKCDWRKETTWWTKLYRIWSTIQRITRAKTDRTSLMCDWAECIVENRSNSWVKTITESIQSSVGHLSSCQLKSVITQYWLIMHLNKICLPHENVPT